MTPHVPIHHICLNAEVLARIIRPHASRLGDQLLIHSPFRIEYRGHHCKQAVAEALRWMEAEGGLPGVCLCSPGGP